MTHQAGKARYSLSSSTCFTDSHTGWYVHQVLDYYLRCPPTPFNGTQSLPIFRKKVLSTEGASDVLPFRKGGLGKSYWLLLSPDRREKREVLGAYVRFIQADSDLLKKEVSHYWRLEEIHPGTDRESPGVHCSIQTLGDARSLFPLKKTSLYLPKRIALWILNSSCSCRDNDICAVNRTSFRIEGYY